MDPRGLRFESLNRSSQLERLEDRRLMASDTVGPVQQEVRLEADAVLQRESAALASSRTPVCAQAVDAVFAQYGEEDMPEGEGESGERTNTAAALDGIRANAETMTYGSAFSPSGEYFATGAREVTVFRTETGEIVRTFTGHASLVMSTVFVSENEIFSVSYDGTARLENMETGETVQTWGIGGIGSDGDVYKRKALVDVAERSSKLIDLDTGEMKDVSPGRYHRFVPGTEYIVYTNEAGTELWREHLTKGGRVKIATLRDDGEAYDLAVSTSGKSVAVVGMHGMVTHVNLRTGQVTLMSTEGIASHGVTFIGEKVITTTGNGKVFVRAIVDGAPTILEELSFNTFVDTPRGMPGTNEVTIVKTSDPSNSRIGVAVLESIGPDDLGAAPVQKTAKEILEDIAKNPTLSDGMRKAQTDIVLSQEELKKTTAALQGADTALQERIAAHAGAVTAHEAAKAEIDAQREAVAAEEAALNDVRKTLDALRMEIDDMHAQEQDLHDELVTITGSLPGDHKALNSAERKLVSAEKALKKTIKTAGEAAARKHYDAAKAKYDLIAARIAGTEKRRRDIGNELITLADTRALKQQSIDGLHLEISAQQDIYDTAASALATEEEAWVLVEPQLLEAIETAAKEVEDGIARHTADVEAFEQAVTSTAASWMTAEQLERAEKIIPRLFVSTERKGDSNSWIDIRIASPLDASRIVVRVDGRQIYSETLWHPGGMQDHMISADLGRATEGTAGGALEVLLYDGDSRDDIIGRVHGGYNRANGGTVSLPVQEPFTNDIIGLHEREPVEPSFRILAFDGATMDLGIMSPYNRSYVEIYDDSNIFGHKEISHEGGTKGVQTDLTFDIAKASGTYMVQLYSFMGGMLLDEIPVHWSKETGKLTTVNPEDMPTEDYDFLPDPIARKTLQVQEAQEYRLYELSRFLLGDAEGIVRAHQPELFEEGADVKTRSQTVDGTIDAADFYGKMIGSLLATAVNGLIEFRQGIISQRDMEARVDDAIAGWSNHKDAYKLKAVYVGAPTREQIVNEALKLYQNQMHVLDMYARYDWEAEDWKMVQAMRADNIVKDPKTGYYVVQRRTPEETVQTVSRVKELNVARWIAMGEWPDSSKDIASSNNVLVAFANAPSYGPITQDQFIPQIINYTRYYENLDSTYSRISEKLDNEYDDIPASEFIDINSLIGDELLEELKGMYSGMQDVLTKINAGLDSVISESKLQIESRRTRLNDISLKGADIIALNAEIAAYRTLQLAYEGLKLIIQEKLEVVLLEAATGELGFKALRMAMPVVGRALTRIDSLLGTNLSKAFGSGINKLSEGGTELLERIKIRIAQNLDLINWDRIPGHFITEHVGLSYPQLKIRLAGLKGKNPTASSFYDNRV